MEFKYYAGTCILSGKEDRGVWVLSTTKPSEAYCVNDACRQAYSLWGALGPETGMLSQTFHQLEKQF